jgi:hypothetical protein
VVYSGILAGGYKLLLVEAEAPLFVPFTATLPKSLPVIEISPYTTLTVSFVGEIPTNRNFLTLEKPKAKLNSALF